MAIWAASWQNQQCHYAPSEDSDQPGHPPSLIRVFAVRMKKAWVLIATHWADSEDSDQPGHPQRRLWSDWADAQANLSLRWAHTHFVGFVTMRLICYAKNLWFCPQLKCGVVNWVFLETGRRVLRHIALMSTVVQSVARLTADTGVVSSNLSLVT